MSRKSILCRKLVRYVCTALNISKIFYCFAKILFAQSLFYLVQNVSVELSMKSEMHVENECLIKSVKIEQKGAYDNRNIVKRRLHSTVTSFLPSVGFF